MNNFDLEEVYPCLEFYALERDEDDESVWWIQDDDECEVPTVLPVDFEVMDPVKISGGPVCDVSFSDPEKAYLMDLEESCTKGKRGLSPFIFVPCRISLTPPYRFVRR